MERMESTAMTESTERTERIELRGDRRERILER